VNFDLIDKRKLTDIKADTKQTIEQLNVLGEKMDKQIALLEQMVKILTKIEERHTDADY